MGGRNRRTTNPPEKKKLMPKQYVHVLIEPDVKSRLEQIRFDFRLPSLSATIIYLIDKLPAGKDKRSPKSKRQDVIISK
jgi:hypothetical protein